MLHAFNVRLLMLSLVSPSGPADPPAGQVLCCLWQNQDGREATPLNPRALCEIWGTAIWEMTREENKAVHAWHICVVCCVLVQNPALACKEMLLVFYFNLCRFISRYPRRPSSSSMLRPLYLRSEWKTGWRSLSLKPVVEAVKWTV